MNVQVTPAPQISVAVTQELTPQATRAARDADGRRVQLVEGSGLQLSAETQCLLRSRLRSASLVLCLGFFIFFLWDVFYLPVTIQNIYLLVSQVGVIFVLGACGGMLCRGCEISTFALRAKELVIFGAPAAFFAYWQSCYVSDYAAAYGVLPDVTTAWTVLVFTYALFIPNKAMRAALVMGALSLAPVLLNLWLWAFDPACKAASNAGLEFVSQELLTMLVCLVIATVGVGIIGHLRREAFEARQIGQYRLRRLLGRGGMGEVYLAEHQLMKRPCAIKLIRPEKAGDPEVIARFEREVCAISQLSHWNSVEIYDYGRAEDGAFFYVMEYLPGMNLHDLVHRHGPLPPPRVVHLLRQTCGALAEAHAQGLVHRDIKPHNIFSAQRGGVYDVAKLLDFGLVKPLAAPGQAELTQVNSITGSPLYLSPEQATGDQEPDARSDLYSLGGVGYFLLTGKPPFDDLNPLKLLIAHAHQPVAPPSQLQDGIPSDLEEIILRCLAKQPDERYQTAAELAQALDSCSVAGLWTAADAERSMKELTASSLSGEPAEGELLSKP